MARIYLDWNASAPLRPEARDAMLRAMEVTGNPSSVHAEGRRARGIVERARARPGAVSVCEHSVESLAAGRFDRQALAGPIVFGGQYQNAQLANACDRVLVF